MAQIELRITAESAADLRHTIESLAGVRVAEYLVETYEHGSSAAVVGAEIDARVLDNNAADEAGEKTKRTRRTKAEMEAARAAEQASAKPADPFGEQIKEVVAEAKAAEQDDNPFAEKHAEAPKTETASKGPSLADIRSALAACVEKFGAKTTQSKLQEKFNIGGIAAASEDQYPEIHAFLTEIVKV